MLRKIQQKLTLFQKRKQRSVKESYLPDPNDIFLVSYPKSGNTWVRFLLANLIKQDDTLIDFHNVHDYCPEWERHLEIIKGLSYPRIIKSHQQYNKIFKKVIYLVRDGRDVYISYYHYLISEGHLSQEVSFKEFLSTYSFPYGCWSDHIKSWLKSPLFKAEKNFHIVYYEDLLSDPLGELSKIADYIGLTTNYQDLKLAVENSSFDQMRSIEQKLGRKYSNKNEPSFVRKGMSGEWKQYFGNEEYKILENRNELETLKSLGYSIDE